MNSDVSADNAADTITVKNLAKSYHYINYLLRNSSRPNAFQNSHTWIDLILIDDNEEVLDYINECSPSFGKHAVIDVTMNFVVPAPVMKSFSYRDYNKICSTTLNELMCCD